MKCPNCQKDNPEKSKFCVHCGQKLGMQACPECGKKIESGATFCIYCGARFEPASVKDAPAAAKIPTKKGENVNAEKAATARKKLPAWAWGIVAIGVVVLAGVLVLPKALNPNPIPATAERLMTTSTPQAFKTVLNPNPIPATAELVYENNFSDTASGWELLIEKENRLLVENGTLGWENQSTNDIRWAILEAAGPFSDCLITTEVEFVSTAEDALVGLVCRYSSEGDGQDYHAELIRNGYAKIYRHSENEWVILGEGDLKKRVTSATLRFDCIGSQMTLYVDGKKVASAMDDQIASGRVGLELSARDVPSQVQFDNFKIYVP